MVGLKINPVPTFVRILNKTNISAADRTKKFFDHQVFT